MSKPVFKAVDRKGKVLIPQPLRQYLGIENGDTVCLSAENGRIVISKAIVAGDKMMPLEAKCDSDQATVSGSGSMDLSALLEHAARFLKDVK